MKSFPMFMLAVAALGGTVAVASAEATLEETLKLPDKTPAAGARFAILVSGDGGWAEFDRGLAQQLAKADLPVVGWNSRAYYWTRRTPDGAAADLARLIRRFQTEWNRKEVVLIGFSRGADVLPFMVNRLPAAEREAVRLTVLLGPSEDVDFELHLLDYVRDGHPRTALPVVPELQRLRGRGVLVMYGEKDDSSCGPRLPKETGRIERVPGDHHLNRDYPRLADLIQDALRRPAAAPPPHP
jgi:type IV secretory pathway VirJ component